MTITFRPAVREDAPPLRTHELYPRKCRICRVEFVPLRRSKGIYCSNRCANAGISRLTAEKRGDSQRGKGEGRTYRKRGGRHEHRAVAEEMLGRPLIAGEVVHHVDGNKLNNDPSNLEVMTQAEHMRRHGLGIPGVIPAHRPWEKRWPA